MSKNPPPFNPLGDGAIPFDGIPAALQFAAQELKAGRSVLLRPIGQQGVIAAPPGEISDAPRCDPYADTVPMELDDLPMRRSILSRLRRQRK